MPNVPFLKQYMNSLSFRQQMTVSSLMQLALLSKSDLTSLASTVGSNINFSSFTPVGQTPNGLITGSDWFLNFRNINLYISQLFTAINQIGLLLDTNQKILLSQLAAAEKQLSALEKQAANFEFLLGSGNTFNYAYTETFHDILGKDSNITWNPSDRDGLGFDLNLQSATVLTDSGSLVLPQDVSLVGAGMSVQLVGSNGSGYVTNDTGVENLLTKSPSTGWSYSISSPTPISSNIDPLFQNSVGAQVILEFTLSEPSNCSQIQIVPLASETIELVDIIAYQSADDTIGVSIQGSVDVNITQSLILSFPLTTIQRFKIYLNQPEYTRTTINRSFYEDRNTRLYNQSGAANKTVNNLGYDTINFSALSETTDSLPVVSNTGFDTFEPDICDLLRTFKTRIGPQSQWQQCNPANDAFLHLYSQWPGIYKTTFLNSTQTPMNNNMISVTPLSSITNNTTPPTNVFPTGFNDSSINNQYGYEYLIGLQSVSIGINIPEYKGVFISNTIPSPGDMGIIVINATSVDYTDTTNTLNNPELTSVEYSVTNVSNPILETDWHPILPLDEVIVASERLFPNAAGYCSLRFNADATEQILVYRNGYNFSSYTKQLDGSDNNIIGINILPQTFAPQDILTISYTPISTSTIVDFTRSGFNTQLPLLSASDNIGAGEGFSATVGDNTIQLSHMPFIDSTQILNETYQPLTVQFSDGTIATNLTNYITGIQPVFPTTGYYYIQSNNNLLFNQPITQKFRVYYQYIQNNMRFRVVLRSNSVNLVSPIVKLVQVKAETRLPNAVQSI